MQNVFLINKLLRGNIFKVSLKSFDFRLSVFQSTKKIKQ